MLEGGNVLYINRVIMILSSLINVWWPWESPSHGGKKTNLLYIVLKTAWIPGLKYVSVFYVSHLQVKF